MRNGHCLALPVMHLFGAVNSFVNLKSEKAVLLNCLFRFLWHLVIVVMLCSSLYGEWLHGFFFVLSKAAA